MIVANFSHPLTPAHLAAIEQLTGQKVERVIEVKTQFDNEMSFGEQARALVESVRLSAGSGRQDAADAAHPTAIFSEVMTSCARFSRQLAHLC
jgi:hypothetical protein